MAMVGLAGSSL